MHVQAPGFTQLVARIFLTASVALATLCFPGTGSSAEPSMLVFASTKDIRNINPHLYAGEMAAQNMVFESLVVTTPSGVRPCLAESWDISDDGLTYTFRLRKGITFTDGTPFTSEAVKLNFDAIVANRSRHAWLELVNAIDSYETPEAHTFILRLKRAYYPTLIELGLVRPFRFLSPACFKDGGTKDGITGYAGTGPWVLSEHKHNQYAVFSRNETYWGKPTKLDRVEWRVLPDPQTIVLALQKGEIDLLFGSDGDTIDLDSFEALRSQSKYATLMSEPVGSRAILLNAGRPVSGDPLFRQAMQHAVDKKSIVEGILAGTETVADSLMARSVPYCDFPLPVRAYDPAKASQLLDQSGWRRGKDGIREKDGKRCELTLYFNAQNAQERSISEYVQADLKTIGVALRIVGEEKQAFLDRQRTGDFDMQYSLSWGAPYDPQSYISSWRQPSHGDYQAQKSLQRKEWLDASITALMGETEAARRQAEYKEVLTYVHESGVYVPISYSRVKAVHKPSLKGVGFGASQYEIPFEQMYFD